MQSLQSHNALLSMLRLDDARWNVLNECGLCACVSLKLQVKPQLERFVSLPLSRAQEWALQWCTEDSSRNMVKFTLFDFPLLLNPCIPPVPAEIIIYYLVHECFSHFLCQWLLYRPISIHIVKTIRLMSVICLCLCSKFKMYVVAQTFGWII